MSILIINANLITLDKSNRVIKDGALYIENDTIMDIGSNADLKSKYSHIDEVLNANSRVVMPGFICAHMHFYSAFATGMPIPPFQKGFVNVLENLWWKIDKALSKEDIYYSALLGYIQSVKSGTTSIIDHHASPSHISGSLDLIEKAGRELGVRSNLCYEVTNRNSDEEAEFGLKENERFIKKCQKSDDTLMSGLVGLHASFTLSNESLLHAQELVEQLDTGVHIHVAEGKADMSLTKEKFSSTVVQRLEKYNLLNNKSILAHCIHLEDRDYPIIQKFQPNLTHQPRSNMNNAVGTMNIQKLIDNNISFGMGTDGMSADMKTEAMVGALIHKHVQKDNTVAMGEIFDALLKTNPQIVKNIMNIGTGVLEVNKKADVLITGYYPKSPVTPNNVMGHMFFGVLHESISSTIIDGQIRMKEGVIPNIDEQSISSKCEELAKNVWNRVNN